jgi:hypothetical protein
VSSALSKVIMSTTSKTLAEEVGVTVIPLRTGGNTCEKIIRMWRFVMLLIASPSPNRNMRWFGDSVSRENSQDQDEG